MSSDRYYEVSIEDGSPHVCGYSSRTGERIHVDFGNEMFAEAREAAIRFAVENTVVCDNDFFDEENVLVRSLRPGQAAVIDSLVIAAKNRERAQSQQLWDQALASPLRQAEEGTPIDFGGEDDEFGVSADMEDGHVRRFETHLRDALRESLSSEERVNSRGAAKTSDDSGLATVTPMHVRRNEYGYRSSRSSERGTPRGSARSGGDWGGDRGGNSNGDSAGVIDLNSRRNRKPGNTERR